MLVEGKGNNGGGGGGIVPITLWSNPSPASEFTSATGDNAAQLSDNINNYSYLKFIFRISTTNSSEHSFIISVNDFKLSTATSGLGNFSIAFRNAGISYSTIYRNVYYNSNTSVNLGQCWLYRANQTNTSQPSLAIPVLIQGINNLSTIIIPEITRYDTILDAVSSASSTFNINNQENKKFLVLLFYHSGSSTAYNRLDGATCSGGTITKLCNLKNANATAYGTFYNIEITSSTCTITAPYNCFAKAFDGITEAGIELGG